MKRGWPTYPRYSSTIIYSPMIHSDGIGTEKEKNKRINCGLSKS